MVDPVVIGAPVRTAFGRLAGTLAHYEAYQLLSHTFAHILKTYDIGPLIDEVIVGNVCNSIGNIARVAALDAGIPEHVPAQTVDRQCASSMEALAIARAKIQSGAASCILVGGVESASQAPWLYQRPSRPYAYMAPQPYKVRFSPPETGDPPMGETAEILADEFGIKRDAMDAFALHSHEKASRAIEAGIFDEEILPLRKKRSEERFMHDECVRADTSLESLSGLRPAFRKDGRVTAGNSSPLNDGAAAALVMSQAFAEAHGIKALCMIKDILAIGLDPARMGLGPAIAIPTLLKRNDLDVKDIDLFEVNEAFASQVLACQEKFPLPPERVNINGGAIAIGHPLGATGLRLVTTLGLSLARENKKTGVASLCIAGGQGMAALIETV